MAEYALTTIDNPYNPFTNFDEWYAYDESHGYHTCAYLARVANTSFALSESQYNEEIENAINEIISYDLRGLYIKISSDA